MKNILCLSWCDADDVINYGQILQGCAMMYILRKYSAGKIIYTSYLPRNIKAKIVYYMAHFNPFSGHLQAYIRTSKFIKLFTKKFEIRFHQVSNKNVLDKLAYGCDLLLGGSDQIWHPQNYDKYYFLDFGPNNLVRASYATSLPKSKIETQFLKEIKLIKESLRKIDYISVREMGSVDFISALSGKKVLQVLDPTYLIPKDFWTQRLDKFKLPSDYIFVYIPNGMDKKMENYIDILKQKSGCREVLILMTRGKYFGTIGQKLKYVGVGQFLSIIKNSSIVFTSSFHAVVFSTIFHKEFWCYDVPNKQRGEDIRLRDLLKLLEIENRLIKDIRLIDVTNKINYDKVDVILDEQKKISISYLNKIFESID